MRAGRLVVIAKLGAISPALLLFCGVVSAMCLFVLSALRDDRSAGRSPTTAPEHHGGSIFLRWACCLAFVIMLSQVVAFWVYARESLSVDVYRLFLPVYFVSLALSGICAGITLVAVAYVCLRRSRR